VVEPELEAVAAVDGEPDQPRLERVVGQVDELVGAGS
jgi:hypothetical protein